MIKKRNSKHEINRKNMYNNICNVFFSQILRIVVMTYCMSDRTELCVVGVITPT